MHGAPPRPVFAFRADASTALGTGHVMRCLTLADSLREAGARTLFLLGAPSEPWNEPIRRRGHDVAPLETGPEGGWRADAAASIAALRREGDPPAWLVVDHYGLDAGWEAELAAVAPRIMAIDDLRDRPHACAILLDPTAGAAARRRGAALVPATTRQLLGPAYALLRPAFAALRARSTAEPAAPRLLVFLSGTDPDGATIQAVEAMSRPSLASIFADIVIGRGNPRRAAIEALASARGVAAIHVDTDDMAGLCASATLAVGAGGGAALERCCLGLPSVALCLAANQADGLAALEAAGAVTSCAASPDAIEAALVDLLADPSRRQAMRQAALAVTDGQGALRVSTLLWARAGCVAAVPATMADADLLFAWRNHPDVRATSFNPAPLVLEDHRAWLARALEDADTAVFIIRAGGPAGPGHPLGSFRLSRKNDAAIVSLALDPGLRGLGLGPILLAGGEMAAANAFAGIRRLCAEVRPDNEASHRLFRGAGYRAISSDARGVLYAKAMPLDRDEP